MGPVGLSCWRSRPAAPRVDGRHEDVGGGGLRRWRSRGRAMRTSGARPGGSSPCAADPLLPAASTAYRCPRYPRGLLGADERRERYVGGVAGQLGQFADAVSDGVVEAQLEQAAGGRLDRDRGYSASLAGLLEPGERLSVRADAPVEPVARAACRAERLDEGEVCEGRLGCEIAKQGAECRLYALPPVGLGGVCPFDEREALCVAELVGGEERVLLVGEVLVEGSQRDGGLRGDVVDVQRGVPLLRGEVRDGVEDPLTLAVYDEAARDVLVSPRQAPPFTEGGVRRERPRRAASLNARARSGTAGSGFGDRRRGGVVGGGPRHEVGYELEQLCVLA